MKIKLLSLASLLAFGAFAQKKVTSTALPVNIVDQPQHINNRGCYTQIPTAEWDAWFNQKVEEFKQQQGKSNMANYTIPVVFHIIHGGQAAGTAPNISQNQINSQMGPLNADYAGTGFNVGNLAATAFSAVGAANTNINFCLAQKDPSGTTLTEPGIHRYNYNSFTLSGGFTQKNPAASVYNTPSTFQNFCNGIIKPQTIWDPTRYLNIWVSDCNSGAGLLGFATFPAGSGLSGLPGGLGTNTTDGVWVHYAATGTVGTLYSSYNKGRTASHEIGHWLGLRHIGGDGNGNVSGDCSATDYCNDTPPQKGGFSGGQYGQNFGTPTYPLYATGSNSCAGAPNGNMFMNFMDYVDDPYCYMFTPDQRTRMQTAMANGTHRNQLTASAATLCNISASAPIANFSIPSNGCINTSIATSNSSSGNPSPTYVWSSSPSSGVSFSPNNTAVNPSINFTTPGSYTISVVASNSLGANTDLNTIVISSCSVTPNCGDTLTKFSNADTLNVYKGGADGSTPGCSPNAGYIAGNNCYGDLEKAQYYTNADYSGITSPEISGVIVLFFKNGTRGTGGNASSTVGMRIYNSTSTTFTGAPSGIVPNSSIGFTSTTLSSILAVTSESNVSYCGNPALAFSAAIIKPYRFNFGTPVTAPSTGGFFASLVLPTGTGDTAVVFNAGVSTSVSRGYEKWSGAPVNQDWYEMKTAWGGINYNLAILPIMQCSTPSGIKTTDFSNAIMLYPNPSNGELSLITTFATNQNIEVTINNVMGQLMGSSKHNNVTNEVFNLDLKNYSNGVYFVTINNGNEKIVKRIILNK